MESLYDDKHVLYSVMPVKGKFYSIITCAFVSLSNAWSINILLLILCDSNLVDYNLCGSKIDKLLCPS